MQIGGQGPGPELGPRAKQRTGGREYKHHNIQKARLDTWGQKENEDLQYGMSTRKQYVYKKD